MSLTKQQMNVLEVMKKIGTPTTPNELQLIYNKQFPEEEIGIGLYKQLTRLISDGYVKRVSDTQYALTDKLDKLTQKEEKKQSIKFTEQEVEQFYSFSKENNFKERIAELVNPGLFGLYRERIACLLSVISSSDLQGDRNRIHVLLEGEPSTGKSAIIKFLEKNVWGIMCDADSSQSSLKGSGRGFQFNEGLLQMADKNSLYIDEIDKMTLEDQNALLGAMEQGSISVNKGNVHKNCDVEVRIIGTCNNKQRLREELLSRFDLQFEIKKITKEEKNQIITKKINDWGRNKSIFDSNFLKKYLQYAKEYNTQLPEDRSRLVSVITNEMDVGKLQGKDIRGDETVIRLAISIAKLKLHPIVTEDDIKDAIELLP